MNPNAMGGDSSNVTEIQKSMLCGSSFGQLIKRP